MTRQQEIIELLRANEGGLCVASICAAVPGSHAVTRASLRQMRRLGWWDRGRRPVESQRRAQWGLAGNAHRYSSRSISVSARGDQKHPAVTAGKPAAVRGRQALAQLLLPSL